MLICAKLTKGSRSVAVSQLGVFYPPLLWVRGECFTRGGNLPPPVKHSEAPPSVLPGGGNLQVAPPLNPKTLNPKTLNPQDNNK